MVEKGSPKVLTITKKEKLVQYALHMSRIDTM